MNIHLDHSAVATLYLILLITFFTAVVGIGLYAMLGWVGLAWLAISFPIGVLIGKMFAGRNG